MKNQPCEKLKTAQEHSEVFEAKCSHETLHTRSNTNLINKRKRVCFRATVKRENKVTPPLSYLDFQEKEELLFLQLSQPYQR